jgi:outer membrane protein assembly factor BamE
MRKLVPLALLLLAGCNYVPSVPGLSAHKIDVQQGNYVTQDMVAKLAPGMSRSQVRFALGTPLVVDPFHSDRWDYVYVLQKKGRIVEQRRIVVIFKDDLLARIDGDVAPATESPSAASKSQPIAQPQPQPQTAAQPAPATAP